MAYYYSNNDGGQRGGFLSSWPPVTKNLIIINVIIFAASLINENFMIGTFALFYPTSPFFHWWQVVTHMFLHGGFWHIFFNMYTLFIFGSVVERYLGPKKFLLFYFVCGLGAVALHLGVEYLQMQSFMQSAADGSATAVQRIQDLKMTPTVGASGAIYGVLMGYAMLFPESRMTLLFPPVTLSAKWMVVVFAVIELLTGVTGLASGIAHFAHLGGMLIGWLMILWWRKRGVLFDQNRL
jgi:membrane associated rhomboid family serine protease